MEEVNWGVIGGSRGVVGFCVGVVGRGGLVDVVVGIRMGDPSVVVGYRVIFCRKLLNCNLCTHFHI